MGFVAIVVSAGCAGLLALAVKSFTFFASLRDISSNCSGAEKGFGFRV
jgi:hypothetical protein